MATQQRSQTLGQLSTFSWTAMSAQRLINRALFFGLLIGICSISLFPYYWMISTSVTPSASIWAFPPKWIPESPTWQPYVRIFQQRPLAMWLANSLLISVTSTLICVIVGTLAAYGFSRFSFRLKEPLMFLILVTQMVPTVLLLIPLFILFRDLKLLDSYSGLVLAYTGFLVPVCTWLLKGFFDSIPQELEEAAFVDGCTRWTSLVRIVLPLARPGIVTTAAYVFIMAWKEFLVAITLLPTAEPKWTVSIGLYTLIGEYVTPWDAVMAGSVITTLPVFLVFLLLQRHIVTALTPGGLRQ